MKKQTNLQLLIFYIFNLVEHSSDIYQVVFLCIYIYTHTHRLICGKKGAYSGYLASLVCSSDTSRLSCRMVSSLWETVLSRMLFCSLNLCWVCLSSDTKPDRSPDSLKPHRVNRLLLKSQMLLKTQRNQKDLLQSVQDGKLHLSNHVWALKM